MSNNSKFLEKYKRLVLEYTNAYGAFDISEDGEEDMGGGPAVGGDPAMGGGDPVMSGDPAMDGGDPAMGGGPAMGGDPAMGGGDPAMGGGDPAMGGDPTMGGDPNGGQGAEGFNPEGGDPNGGLDGMGGQDPMMGGDTMQSDDEVIDVDDLTKSQENAEKKIDKMNAKFEKLMGAVEVLIKQNNERDRQEAENAAKMKAELEKRIPTPQQRMTMRSTKSAPYSMTPNEYMNNYAPENYSDEDDNNGADDMQYQITKGDIDSFTDYNSIAKDLDIEHQGLRDILGF